MGVILNRIKPQFIIVQDFNQCFQHPAIFKLFCEPDRYTHMQVIEELPLLKMSTNNSGHPRIYREIK